MLVPQRKKEEKEVQNEECMFSEEKPQRRKSNH